MKMTSAGGGRYFSGPAATFDGFREETDADDHDDAVGGAARTPVAGLRAGGASR